MLGRFTPEHLKPICRPHSAALKMKVQAVPVSPKNRKDDIMKFLNRIYNLTDDECMIIMIGMAIFTYGFIFGYIIGGGLL